MSKIKFHFTSPEENTGFLLWQATMTWQRQMNRALNEIQLTHTQFVIMAALGWLLKTSDEVTQKDIADHSNTDRMMVSKILRNIQKKGFIERRESLHDARSKWVNLTDDGKMKLRQALNIVQETDHQIFSNLQNNRVFDVELTRLISKQ